MLAFPSNASISHQMHILQPYSTWFDWTTWATPRWKTAITRSKLSTPMHTALVELFHQNSQVLDFGCGHGQDCDRLNKINEIKAVGFDPYFFPNTDVLQPTEIVTMIYVLNTIESASERSQVVQYCWELTQRALVVAVRTNASGEEVITRHGTFQKYYQVEQFAIYLSKEIPQASILFPKPGIAFLYK